MAVSTVKATINGTQYTLTYNGGNGKYEATINAPATTSYNLTGHYYGVQLVATDDAGNSTTKDQTDGILGTSLQLKVKETNKPVISAVVPSSGATLASSTPTITFSLRDEAGGSGINIGTLVLKIDGGTAITNVSTGMTCNSVTNGYDCTYVVQSAITDGSHTLTIDISDFDGNTATESSSTFKTDTTPPSLNVTSPTDGLITNNASLTVSGTTDDVTSNPVTVTIKLNGVDQGAVSVVTTNFSKAITLAQGVNTIIVTSTDGAGKFSTITRTVTLNTTPPTISAVTITPNPVNCGATYTISVTVSDS